jgi:hypothetical protein
MLLRSIALNYRVVDFCYFCILYKYKAFNLMQEFLNRLSALAKAADNDILVKTYSARASAAT